MEKRLAGFLFSLYWVIPIQRLDLRTKQNSIPFYWVTAPQVYEDKLSRVVTWHLGQACPFSKLWQYGNSPKDPWTDRSKDNYWSNRSASVNYEEANGAC